MGRKPSLKPGDVLNEFLVLDLLPPGKSGEHRKFLVKCPKCGETSAMLKQNIVKSKSCGCQKNDSSTWSHVGAKNKPWTLPEGEAMFRALFYSYKKSAKKRGYDFELTESEFREKVTSPCTFCGSCCQSTKVGSARTNGDFNYTGIDRYVNTEGYTLKNSVPCCKVCNYMKLDHDPDFFLLHIKRILEHFNHENHLTLD
jgi:hypothetical protein